MGRYRAGMSTDAAPRMVAIAAGTVTMTDARTRTTWSAEVAAFVIAAHPLTQAPVTWATDCP